MVEKSGAEFSALPGLSEVLRKVMMLCALNIARWWLVEHCRRERGNNSITSFPGEMAWPRSAD